jgi:uncharacterized protein
MKEFERIIRKYYPEDTERYRYYYVHCLSVTKLALKVADQNPQYKVDREYLEAAGMLHDIGIFMTNAPEIGCFGNQPYICHGFLGRELLEKEGLPEIAPVCERHIGTGITIGEIKERGLPFPIRDMTPQTVEEKIVCYADKFFSKSSEDLTVPKPAEKIRNKLLKHGIEKVDRFDELVKMFGIAYVYSQ